MFIYKKNKYLKKAIFLNKVTQSDIFQFKKELNMLTLFFAIMLAQQILYKTTSKKVSIKESLPCTFFVYISSILIFLWLHFIIIDITPFDIFMNIKILKVPYIIKIFCALFFIAIAELLFIVFTNLHLENTQKKFSLSFFVTAFLSFLGTMLIVFALWALKRFPMHDTLTVFFTLFNNAVAVDKSIAKEIIYNIFISILCWLPLLITTIYIYIVKIQFFVSFQKALK